MTTFKTMGENVIGGIAVGVTLLGSPWLRRWYNGWGASQQEQTRVFPGDALTPAPQLSYTRALTIQAPAAKVWAWLVQIGQERGGLYSYELLENLIGCQMHNAARIVPEWQNLQVGDRVRLGPKGYPLFKVKVIQTADHLIMLGADPLTEQTFEEAPATTAAVNSVWAFYLQALDANTTRLICRSRTQHPPTWGQTLIWRVIEPINFVMERRMLLGLKARAEMG